MLGKKYLAKARRLSEIAEFADIPTLSEARFPGSHCPLFGAILALRQIEEAAMLVVGTDECTFYSKSMVLSSGDFGPDAERCFSLILDHTDVSFGCREKLAEALSQIRRETDCRIIFVITTCIVELIGDDLDSICANLEEELGLELPVVHTEHFKCENHLPGMERVLSACLHLMRADVSAAQTGGVNLLGHRHAGFEQSELAEFLRQAGVEVKLVLPSACRIEQLRAAPLAKLNIVTDAIGLPLARAMKERFGTAYIWFDRFVNPATISAAYEKLASELCADDAAKYRQLSLQFAERRQAVRAREAELSARLSGISYIYGNTPLLTSELNAYLCQLGMIPSLIQMRELKAEDQPFIQQILRSADPYVTKNANISPLQSVYEVLKPGFYIGHEYASRLRHKGIIVLTMDRLGKYYGFQLSQALLDLLDEAVAAREELLAQTAAAKTAERSSAAVPADRAKKLRANTGRAAVQTAAHQPHGGGPGPVGGQPFPAVMRPLPDTRQVKP